MSMQIVGYSNKLSVENGDHIDFMVSSSQPQYQAKIVRLIHGDEDPRGPGFKSAPIASEVEGIYEGKMQGLCAGSYIRVPMCDTFELGGSLTIQLWMWPTLINEKAQTLISQGSTGEDGFELYMEQGKLHFRVGKATVSIHADIQLRTWYSVSAVFSAAAGQAFLMVEPLHLTKSTSPHVSEAHISAVLNSRNDMLIGASEVIESDQAKVHHFYNGKIEAPIVYNRALSGDELSAFRQGTARSLNGIIGAWDFSKGISTWSIVDSSANELTGVAINMPTRASTGHNWTGVETSWRHAPDQYGAIHFHDDDLSDAEWPVSIKWCVPVELPSGIYALHVSTEDAEDYIPFTVRPQSGKPTAKIVLLLPTFSYMAYANERLLDTVPGLEHPYYPRQPQDRYIVENRLLSLYDVHSDGSGVCYSSRLKPIVNMRPKCVMQWLDGGIGSAHGFNADLFLVDWLHENGFQFDVVTDEDLHHEGQALLDPYNVVLTGTHPEYWSNEMMDGAQAYLRDGGRMMYLGGNGMYWVTQLDPDTQASVEIRRRGPATRMWEPEPGEAHLSSSGELGGLWRYRGRSPQSWVGVGMASETSGHGRPYARQPDSYTKEAAFVFEGLEDDELIGDLPSLVQTYGAGGYEFDRADFALGTPAHALILATASGFSDDAQAVCEEIMTSNSLQSGSVNPNVKADMVLIDYPKGGAVFSTGSISWCGCLSQNAYDNNVAQVTRNVLAAFASDEQDYRAPTGPELDNGG